MKRFPLFAPLLAASVMLGGAAACTRVVRPDGGEGLLSTGHPAPEVSGQDQDGKPVQLKSLRGKPVVVYFYPRDGTPGCTEEACAFRDVWSRYTSAGIVVIGVSTDDSASHKKFAQEYGLPFQLVADPQRIWARAFGVPTMLGMSSRVSFLIDRDGSIAKVYADVDPGVHANQVLADAGRLPPPGAE